MQQISWEAIEICPLKISGIRYWSFFLSVTHVSYVCFVKQAPVPLCKTSRVSHNDSYAKFGTNAMLMHCKKKNLAVFKREWNWTLGVSKRG